MPKNFLKGRHPLLWLVLLLALLTTFYSFHSFSKPRVLRELVLWGWLSVTSLVYTRWMLALHDNPTQPLPRWPWLLLAGVLVLASGLACPLFHSTDLAGYVNRGWQQWHYGQNPYVHVVADITRWAKDRMITDHWVNNPCPYGFLFARLAQGVTALGGGKLSLTMVLFKAVNGLALAVSGWLAWRLGYRHRAMALWFSPLLLLQSIANGHNDILMGSMIALGAAMGLWGYGLWILPIWTLAGLLKYGAYVLLPLGALWVYRQWGLRLLLGSLALSLTLWLAISVPYLQEWSGFALDKIGENATLSHHSLHSLMMFVVRTLTRGHEHWLFLRQWTDVSVKILLMGLWSAGYAGLLWRLWRQKQLASNHHYISAAVWVLGSLVAVVSAKFYPWYWAMVLPLAAMVSAKPSDERLWQGVLWLSITLLFSFTFVGQAQALNVLVLMILPTVLFLKWTRLPAAPQAEHSKNKR